MNAANDPPNYLKSNNRYVSWNKQAPGSRGAWGCWIIIRWRGRAGTCAFVDLLPPLPLLPPRQVCRAGAPSVCILVGVKGPPLAREGHTRVLLSQGSIPPMWGAGTLTRRPLQQRGASLEAKGKLIIILYSVALSLKHSERRREGRGRRLGRCVLRATRSLENSMAVPHGLNKMMGGSSASTSGYVAN